MRIAILNWKDPLDAAAGGAERYVERVARIWAASGHAVTLVVPCPAGRPDREILSGVEYLRVGTRRSIFRQARRYLRRHGSAYDLVLESVSTRPFFAHRVVGTKATAFYHQVADDVWPQEFPFPVSLLGRHVLEPRWIRGMRTARVVVNSPSTAADVGKRGVPVAGIVSPGTDGPASIVERRLGEPPRLVYIGRLHRTKRPGDAVQAFSILAREHPGASLDVVGGGYLLDELRRSAPPGVTVHGYVSEEEKARLLHRADLLLVPGTREGWGIVVLEAAAHGVPAVAYDIPGLRDAVVDGVTGVLTKPTPEALAAAASAVLRSPARWSAFRRAARERALHFTWERAAAALLEIAGGFLPGAAGENEVARWRAGGVRAAL